MQSIPGYAPTGLSGGTPMSSMPETCYAKSGDNYVAYQVMGEGPFDLVYVPGFISHLDLHMDWPLSANFFPLLYGGHRVLREYWSVVKPKAWLFPGSAPFDALAQPMSPQAEAIITSGDTVFPPMTPTMPEMRASAAFTISLSGASHAIKVRPHAVRIFWAHPRDR
jgi:hypothetical protein